MGLGVPTLRTLFLEIFGHHTASNKYPENPAKPSLVRAGTWWAWACPSCARCPGDLRAPHRVRQITPETLPNPP